MMHPPLTPQGGFRPTPYGFQPGAQWSPVGQGFPPPRYHGAPPPWQQHPPRRSSTGLLVALVVASAALLGVMLLILTDSQGSTVDVQYQNEDYEVPPVSDNPPDFHIPDTETEARKYLEDNPLYDITLPSPVRCEIQLSDKQKKSDAALEEELQSYMNCLTRVWGPALEEAGFIPITPKVTVVPSGSPFQSKCEVEAGPNAFFCLLDQRIFLNQEVAESLAEGGPQARSMFHLIIAHEYGHAVQGRAGILGAGLRLQYHATSEKEVLDISRRKEVQADALAGLALNSLGHSLGVTDKDRQEISEMLYEIGDDQLRRRAGLDPDQEGDHGRGENRRMWGERGLNSADVGVSNSFVAPSSEVR
ncbi:hypothetical protein EII34_04205 [Arachnia propionica]|uniref:Metalloprotease n=1 Tax=Arachnia propionica TaxID=1750 RepID=A0A3P1TCV0_9ACTN|nr:neutral zinc metallopeptidase [Arachnia propionica]MDO5084754.1 neutral zinc metallopeptidase [Arachnia propionica]RRD06323.1 hypothetical protein EII34_04205 [Arachnia propionica]